ncbi:MAG: DUF1801 domain-containing protein [Pseudomonadota bacterium]
MANENKTLPTTVDPADYVAAVAHPTRRKDAETLLSLFGRITGWRPQMWGPSLIGFGRYHYKTDAGREGDMFVTGFSPRKANQVLYILPGYTDHSSILGRLGKHKTGRACIYINKLADVDLNVVEELIGAGLADMKSKYDVHPK